VHSSADVSLALHSRAGRQLRSGLARAARGTNRSSGSLSAPRNSRFFWSLAFLSASSSPSSITTSSYGFSAVNTRRRVRSKSQTPGRAGRDRSRRSPLFRRLFTLTTLCGPSPFPSADIRKLLKRPLLTRDKAESEQLRESASLGADLPERAVLPID